MAGLPTPVRENGNVASLRFTSEQLLDDGVLERDFTLGEVPGVLWTSGSEPAPLILLGHPGGFHKRLPRLVARARYYAAEHGFAVAAIDAPGAGDRPPSAEIDEARARFKQAILAREPIDEFADAFITPLVEQGAPEWQATLDALTALPEVSGRIGYEGMIALGIRLAAIEPRISAAVFFGMGFVPATLRAQAAQIDIPLQFLMQWDDKGNGRQEALGLFDIFGTEEKTLHANLGGHTGTPWFEVEDAGRFLARHLK